MVLVERSTALVSGSALLLGPAIIIASLSSLAIPYILSLSIDTLILLASAIFGLVIIAIQLVSILQTYYNDFRTKTIKYGNDLIIDDLMHDILGAEGLISCFWGSWVGTLLLYFLPLDKDLRLRIIRNIHARCNVQNYSDGTKGDSMKMDEYVVDQILFQPGGIWKIFNMRSSEAEAEEAVASPINYHDHTATVAPQVLTDLEMTWDTEDIDYLRDEAMPRNGHGDNDDSDEHSTVDTDISMNSPLPAQIYLEKKEDQAIPPMRNDSMEQICLDVVRNIARGTLGLDNVFVTSTHENFHPVNSDTDTLVQRIGVAASVLLFLQMRYSTTARKTIYHMAQGSIAVGLVSIAAGSFGSAHVKKQVIEWVRQQGYSYRPREHERIRRPIPFVNHQDQSSQDLGWIGFLQKHSSLLLSRFKHDDRFKRKWQGCAALFVLFYFRQRKRKGLNGRQRTRMISRS